MKIGVVSDTHLQGYTKELAQIVDRYLTDVDLILHAGDIVDLSVLNVFKGKPTKAVRGNMDPPSVALALPDKVIFECGGFCIGLIHGWGPPEGIEERILKSIGSVDCLVFGHTHRPKSEKIGNTYFFNPGSATDKRFSEFNSIGIIEIDKEIKGEIIVLS